MTFPEIVVKVRHARVPDGSGDIFNPYRGVWQQDLCFPHAYPFKEGLEVSASFLLDEMLKTGRAQVQARSEFFH